MTKRYRVTLEAEERDHLRQLLSKGKADVRRLKHAQILLAADESDAGPALSDNQISRTVDVARATVERIRQRFVEEGLELSLSPYRTPNRIYRTKLDGRQEAHLIAMACSTPPEGRSRWTLSLLADQMVELKYIDSLSRETVRQTLKKMNSSRT
jgi:transposase